MLMLSAESDTVSDEFDDASIVLDDSGSLGPFLDSLVAKSKEIENAKILMKILLHLLALLNYIIMRVGILMILILKLMMNLLDNI